MIQKAIINDASDIAKLAVKMWQNHSTDELKKNFEDTIRKNDCAIFIYKLENTVIGFAQCGLRYDYVEGTNSSPVGYLEGIFVKEDFRNNGYAKELLKKCEQWAKECGCSEFASDCELTNNDRLKFHLKNGFAEVNRIICFTKEI